MKSKIIFTLSLLVFSFASKVNAQADVNNAQAVFIYNFLSHIKWPDADIQGSYVIGVYGETSTYGYLKKYTANRKVGNKSIQIVKCKTIEEAASCQVLFVTYSKSKQFSEIANQLKGKSCLIIGEKPGTTNQGAVVYFDIKSGKLRYKIDENNAKAHNLFVSKALLNMSL